MSIMNKVSKLSCLKWQWCIYKQLVYIRIPIWPVVVSINTFNMHKIKLTFINSDLGEVDWNGKLHAYFAVFIGFGMKYCYTQKIRWGVPMGSTWISSFSQIFALWLIRKSMNKIHCRWILWNLLLQESFN